MGSRAALSIQKLERELLLARQRQLVRLNSQFVAEIRRVNEAYNEALADIRLNWDDFLDGNITQDVFLNRVELALSSLSESLEIAGASLQLNGAIEGVRLGIQGMQAGEMGVLFNMRTAESIAAGLDIVNSTAFQEAISFYGAYHTEQINLLIAQGIADGLSAAGMWAQINQYLVDGNAQADWMRLLRTLQNYASRYGTQQIYAKNGIKEWIWSANIGDSRTCVMCYVMHGTRHPISEMLNEHHNGRCAMIPVTPTWAELGFSSGKEPNYETGLAWLEQQPMATQQQILGPQLYTFWRNGDVVLSPETVVEIYSNPIFGDMQRRASNQLILERSRIV